MSILITKAGMGTQVIIEAENYSSTKSASNHTYFVS